jgi:hypothetical protein
MEGGYKRPIHSSLHDVDDREWIWRKKKDRGAKKMRTTRAKAEEEPGSQTDSTENRRHETSEMRLGKQCLSVV